MKIDQVRVGRGKHALARGDLSIKIKSTTILTCLTRRGGRDRPGGSKTPRGVHRRPLNHMPFGLGVVDVRLGLGIGLGLGPVLLMGLGFGFVWTGPVFCVGSAWATPGMGLGLGLAWAEPRLGLGWAWAGLGLGLGWASWAWAWPGLGLGLAWAGLGLGAWAGLGLGLGWTWAGPGLASEGPKPRFSLVLQRFGCKRSYREGLAGGRRAAGRCI